LLVVCSIRIFNFKVILLLILYVELTALQYSIMHAKNAHTTGFAEDDNWKADAQSLSVGDGSKINVDFKSPTIAVFGSTYPWMSLPTSISDALNAFMESKNWGSLPFVDCTKRSSWPDVTIVIETVLQCHQCLAGRLNILFSSSIRPQCCNLTVPASTSQPKGCRLR
jgi:hypothetical protein